MGELNITNCLLAQSGCRAAKVFALLSVLLMLTNRTRGSEELAAKKSVLTAKEIVFALRSSLSSYDSAECRFSTYFKSLRLPGTEKGPDGMGLYSQFEWGWQAEKSEEYLKGRWGYPHKGKFLYGFHRVAYNGRELRTLNESDRGGRIAHVGDFFLVWSSPLTLLGRDIAESPRRDLLQLLDDESQVKLADGNSVDAEKNGEPQITVAYRQGDQQCTLRITCDPSAGFLPRRLEVVHDLTRCVMVRIETTKFFEVLPNVWFPLHGSIERFYVENPPPETAEAISNKRLSVMPAEEALRVLSSVQWRTKPLGYGKQVFVVEPDSLRVNQGIAADQFVLEFPRGTAIWDEFRQAAFVEGMNNFIQSANLESQGSAYSRWGLLTLNVVVVFALVAVILRKRWARSS